MEKNECILRCFNESQTSDESINNNNNSLEKVTNCMNCENYLSEFGSNYLSNDSNDSVSKSPIIYESIISEDSNNDDYNSYDYNIDQSINLDINECEHKIRRLSDENKTLNESLIRLEEQIIDLINDKQSLEKSLKSQNHYFKNKIYLFESNIQELNHNIESLENTNFKLEEKLNQKSKEKTELELRLQEIKDKLLCTQFELNEIVKNEAELRMSYEVTKDALNVSESEKFEAIQHSHELYLQQCSHQNQIIKLNEQVDALKKENIDKDNELWFFRSGDRTSIDHDTNVDLKTQSNGSLILNDDLNHSNIGKTSKYPISSKMDPLCEKLSDIEDNECLSCEDQIDESDKEKVMILDEETKAVNSLEPSAVFPSLPNIVLRKLQLLRENSCSVETLTPQEIESKFLTLSLAFKTDKFTLEQRLHLQKHQRDVAEQDALNEIQSLRDSIQHLNQMILCSDEKLIISMRSEIKELINKIETQVEVIGKTNAKISSRSELYGAVKQEERVSSAFDVILMHTENLRRLKEKDEKELEETKKLLNSSNRKIECESDSENDSHSVRRSVRSISASNMPKMNFIRVRRSSISSIEILPNTDTVRRTVQNSNNVTPRYVPSNIGNRSRRLSMPAAPALPVLFRSKFGTDSEISSPLGITTEEIGGSESDCASSAANQESDDEQTSHALLLQKKLSEDQDINTLNSSLIVSEPSLINTSFQVINNYNNNNESETFSHSYSHENSSDNEREDETDDNSIDKIDLSNLESHKTCTDVIEYRYLVDVFNFCFDGRLSSYIKDIISERRFIFAIILLVMAVLIIIWSLLPSGIPCECHCFFSWEELFPRILLPYLSKEKFSPTQ